MKRNKLRNAIVAIITFFIFKYFEILLRLEIVPNLVEIPFG
jgi:hypothetical protein